MADIRLNAGDLRHRLRIERPVADNALDGAGSGEWVLVAEAYASVQDALPGRGEVAGIATTLTRPARVRMRYRDDVTAAMRFVAGNRIMYIVSGPAELGFRDGVEFMVAEYMPGGNPA